MNQHDTTPVADRVFDGGAMDCGSGLILLIRQNMLSVPEGGILEIRSSEPTVEVELPPWCRMVGHSHIASREEGTGLWRHWVRRGSDVSTEKGDFEVDTQKAKEFRFSVRARRTTPLETTVYARNFSWKSGTSVSFDRKSVLPGSLEQFLGALVADVINGFALRCSRNEIVLDELEGMLNASLHNSLAAVGLEAGDSSVKSITLNVYATTPSPENAIRDEWTQTLIESPVFQTLTKSCELNANLVLV